MKALKITTVLIAALALTSCNFHVNMGSVTGNGNVTTEDRHFSEEIKAVRAANGLNIELVESQTPRITVEADENLHEYIETKLSNGTLYIKTTKNIRNARAKKVTIAYTTELNAVRASSGANVKGLSNIISDHLDLRASSGAQINISILAKDLSAQASSGSNITLNGQSKNFSSKASSGSSINAKDLQSVHCISKASSGASVTLNAEKSLDAKASSGADIRYYGNPDIVNQNNSSSGRVRKM